MNTLTRHDLYAPVHKALRLFMTDTLQALGRMDLDDPQDVGAGLARLDTLLEAASSHLRHENEVIHPALEQRRRGTSERIASEHREHLEAIAALRAQAAALRERCDPAAAHRLYRQLAAFVAENFEHMDVEETRHNQALWDTHTDAELHALEARILAGIGPQAMAGWLHWMLAAFRPVEQARLIAGLPPEAQGPVLAQARAVLDDAAWARLGRVLAPAPPGGLLAA